jgi:hypothetical protein
MRSPDAGTFFSEEIRALSSSFPSGGPLSSDPSGMHPNPIGTEAAVFAQVMTQNNVDWFASALLL